MNTEKSATTGDSAYNLVFGMVLKVTGSAMQMFTITTEFGVLQSKLRAGDLEPNHGAVAANSNVTVSLREAAREQNCNNVFLRKKCNCTSSCSTKRCACRLNNIACSTHCHQSKTCSNTTKPASNLQFPIGLMRTIRAFGQQRSCSQLRSWPITQRVWSTVQLTKCAAHLANCAAILRGWSTVAQLVNCRAFGQLCHRRSAIGQMRRLVKRALHSYFKLSRNKYQQKLNKIMKISQEDVILIKNLYLSKQYGARRLLSELLDKCWKLGSIDS